MWGDAVALRGIGERGGEAGAYRVGEMWVEDGKCCVCFVGVARGQGEFKDGGAGAASNGNRRRGAGGGGGSSPNFAAL